MKMNLKDMEGTTIISPQRSSFISKEITRDCRMWHHKGCWFQSIGLLFKRSLIQNPKFTCDCVVVIPNIWPYYNFLTKLKIIIKGSKLN